MSGPGEMLRLARESLGLPLDEVVRQTHIRVEYLTALEQDDYAALPGDVYTRGFLRNYSSVLGLDPLAVVTAYEARNDAPRRRARAGTAPAPPPRRPPPPIRIQPLSPTPIDTRVRYAPSFWLMGLLAFVLLILGYLGYTTLTGIRQAQTPQATPTTVGLRTPTALSAILPTALVSSTPVLTTLPTPGPGGVVAGGPGSKLPTPAAGAPPAGATPGAPAAPTLPVDPAQQTAMANLTATPTPGGTVAVQVTIGSQNAWLKVDIDGKTVFGSTLRAGDVRTWTGQNRIRIRFARADITSVVVNGVDKGLAGDPSQTVITKEWDATGAERVIP